MLLGQPQSRWLLLVWGLLTWPTLALAGMVLLGAPLPVGRTGRPGHRRAGRPLGGRMNLEHRQTIPNVAYGQSARGDLDAASRGCAGRPIPVAQHRDARVRGQGDREYEERYASLARLALDNLLVTVKWNETLWPNVPLVYRLPSADGYDGGVLPLRTFYVLSRAMLGEERARPDGVLASRSTRCPSRAGSTCWGCAGLLASRAKDVTRGAIYYDRAISVSLRPGQQLSLTALPGGEFTKLGLISSVRRRVVAWRAGRHGAGSSPARPRLARVPLLVGQQTAPAAWKAEHAPDLERVQGWSAGPDDAADWIADVAFRARPVARLEIVEHQPRSDAGCTRAEPDRR